MENKNYLPYDSRNMFLIGVLLAWEPTIIGLILKFIRSETGITWTVDNQGMFNA